MPITSGPIRYSDVRTLTGQSGSIKASNFRFRVLANGVNDSSAVKMSNCYNKPVAGSITLTTSQNWTAPAYTNLTITIKGAGGGGGKGQDVGFTTSCVPVNSGANGTSGSGSSFLGYQAYGGGGGERQYTSGLNTFGGNPGTPGGNNVNTNTGGGGDGGAGVQGTSVTFCPVYTGGRGGDGGYVNLTLTIGQTGPEYLSVNFATVGTGATIQSAGTNGSILIQWS